MTITLSESDKEALRIAAYGAVSLLSAAGAAGGSPHKISTDGSIALASTTGRIGHILAKPPKGTNLKATSIAALADTVLPGLTEAVRLLRKADPAEADNFRGAVLLAVEAGNRAGRDEPGPTMTAMTDRITAALDAA